MKKAYFVRGLMFAGLLSFGLASAAKAPDIMGLLPEVFEFMTKASREDFKAKLEFYANEGIKVPYLLRNLAIKKIISMLESCNHFSKEERLEVFERFKLGALVLLSGNADLPKALEEWVAKAA